jgi:hypothetical protein
LCSFVLEAREFFERPTISEFECLNLACMTGFLLILLTLAESILSITIPDVCLSVPVFFFSKDGLYELIGF